MRTGDTKCYGCNMEHMNCYETCPNSPAKRGNISTILSTADVVPRSEYEELQKKLDDYKKFVGEIRVTTENHAVIIDTEHTEYIDKRVAEGLKNLAVKQAKQEVAGKIFEEIHKEIELALDSNYKVLKEHRDKENPIFNELVSRVKGKIDALRGTEDFIDELKKKYIGEVQENE